MSSMSMYVPAWQGLALTDLWRRQPAAIAAPPYPFNTHDGTYFYTARSGIYHLIRALGWGPGDVVLAPDYHSGVEIWGIRAAGADVRYYHVNNRLEPDIDELRSLCGPDVRALYVIHYLGWPQPIAALAAFCRERGLPMIEDCALSLLSRTANRPLGTFGDYSVFCLYKSLPVPNGGLIVQNHGKLPALQNMALEAADRLSVVARSADLVLSRIRKQSNTVGRVLFGLKSATGRALTRNGVNRLAVGDMLPEGHVPNFGVDRLNVGMCSLSYSVLNRLDYAGIVARRRENYLRLIEALDGGATLVHDDLPDGVCPLSCPILVPDKHAAAQAFWAQGICAIEMWNDGHPEAKPHESDAARFYRRHLLELPIHQDVTPEEVDYMAGVTRRLGLRMD